MSELDLWSVLLIAVGLSADCFAVALAASTSGRSTSPRDALRVCLAFGVAQAVMPVLGWLAGRTFVEIIADYDHWVAFALLLVVGGHMIWESFRGDEGEGRAKDFSRGLTLLVLAVATSIDALAVGLSFAFLSVSIVVPVVTIGVVAALITGVGFLVGRKVSRVLGERAETLGGIILIGIGLRILLSHLL
jgi:putative Mn2+ efflux pump MntP